MSEDGYRKTFVKQLAYYMNLNNKNQTDLMNDLGLGSSTVSSWCTGAKMPRMGKIQMLADYFNIDKSDLLEEPNSLGVKANKGVQINVLGKVAAGIPIEAIENIVDTEEISQKMASTGEFFGLKIKGDSMQPTICNGDTVIVKRQDDAESGDIVIALINGDNATCKRLVKYAEGINLISLNPAYEPMVFSNKDIKEKPVKILGKVVENRRKF